MRKKLFAGLAIGVMLLGANGVVNATPTLTDISAIYTQNSFNFEALYDVQLANFDPFTPGGWVFQLFLDTDQNDSTGYSGFEFNVRGIEQETNGFISVRRTEGGGGPGGWGESTGSIPLVIENSIFALSIPLSVLDYDDGNLDYFLHIYDTVEASTPSGISYVLTGHYNGSSTPVPEPATILLMGTGLAGLFGASKKKH